uniref:Uncharacterized protein n=1 Tax=Grammatophora oceanica TaxID=210454 RepID=A0A7S1UQR2_9STRA
MMDIMTSPGSPNRVSDLMVEDDIMMMKNDVMALIEKKNWEALIQKTKHDKSIAATMLTAGATGKQGNFALHEVCKNQPSVAVLLALIEANPGAVKTKGCWGYLPLHYACTSDAGKEVVKKLLEVHPGGARTRDEHESVLPLHLACKWGNSPDVIIEIMTTYPEGIFIRDASGRVPMDHAKKLHSNKEPVMAALKLGPMFVATSKSAQRRVADEHSARVKGMEQAHTAHVQKWEARYKQERDHHEEMKMELEGELKHANDTITEVADDLKNKTTECESVVEKNGEMETKINTLEKDFDDARKEHKAVMQSARVAHEAHKQENQSIIESLRFKVGVLETAKAGLEGQLSSEQTLNASLAKRAALVEPLQQEKEMHLETIAHLENKVTVHEKAQFALSNKAALLEEAKAETEAELEKVRRDLSNTRVVNVTVTKELADSRLRVDIYDNRMEELKKLISAVSLNMNSWSIEATLKAEEAAAMVDEENKQQEFDTSV